jgi:NAD(P)H dehydrogenase (quinone)
VTVFRIDEHGDLPEGALDALGAHDAIIYGSPTYMGGPAWQFKKFADASSKPWFSSAWKDKIAAGFTNSASVNGDKFSTIAYFSRCHSSMDRSGSAPACCRRTRKSMVPTT